jgi:hypothetical protein
MIADLIISSQTMTQPSGDPRNSGSRSIATLGRKVRRATKVCYDIK